MPTKEEIHFVSASDLEFGMKNDKPIKKYAKTAMKEQNPLTAAQIANYIFYLPATNGQAEASIESGAKLIEQFAAQFQDSSPIEGQQAEKIIDNSFEQYWNKLMDNVCDYLKLSDDEILGLRCHVSEIEHDEFADAILALFKTKSKEGELREENENLRAALQEIIDIKEPYEGHFKYLAREALKTKP